MIKLTRNINKSSRTFLKFLISYISILITPIIILCIILNNYLVQVIKDEVIRSNMDALVLSKRLLDKEIQQVHGISYKLLYTNKYLSGYFGMERGFERNALIRDELKNSILSNLFITEVVLYTKEDLMMYTSNGHYPLDDFFGKMYKYEHYNKEAFITDITSITKMHLVPVENVNTLERYVTALYPSHSFALRPRPGLMFLIQERKFLDYIKPPTDIPGSNNFVMDEFYNVIVAVNDDEYIYTEELKSLVMSVPDNTGYAVTKANNDDYFLFVIRSDIFSLKYVSMLPVRAVYGKVYEAQFVVGLGLILIIVLGVAVIYYFMMINYFPIRQLSKNIQTMFKVESGGDEIETVKEAFTYLADQNTNLNVRLKDSVEKVKDATVFSLLKGQIESREEFNEYGRDMGLCFSFPYFYVAILYAESKGTAAADKNTISAFIQKNSVAYGYQFYCSHDMEVNQFVVIINTRERNDEKITEFLNNVREQTRSESTIVLTAGLGNAYDDMKLLPHSYIEASTALKHRFIKGNDQIILIGSLTKDWTFAIDEYPEKEALELNSYIKQRNIAKIENCINNMAAYLKNSGMPIFTVRSFCYDIISDIMQSRQAINRNDFPDIFFIESVGTIDELFDIIKNLCISICQKSPDEQNAKESVLIDQISEYIKQNYYKCDFSIQGVSDFFDLKLSYMSQYFKSQTGSTIMDYVTDLRVDRAKNFLITTKLPLNAVSEQVGYYNVSSFIRRFKQLTLMTPGEYRKEYGIEADE